MNDNPLLEVISREEFSAQNGFKMGCEADYDVPMHRLLRQPEHLEEFDWETNRDKIICCDNHTVICVCDNTDSHFEEVRYAKFIMKKFSGHYLRGAIFGKTDAAIAETTTWFWSLPCLGQVECLIVGDYSSRDRRRHFDLANFSAEQVTQILGSNPTRCINFTASTLTTEQSVLLATRPYQVHLELNRDTNDAGLSDEGTAFLSYPSDKPVMSRANLERLLRLDSVIDKLKLGYQHEDIVLSPFAAKVNALDYDFKARHLRPESFESIDIVARALKITVDLEGATQWSEVLISLLNRIACMGHFEVFSFSIDCFSVLHKTRNFDQVMVEVLINVIAGNPQLTSFDFRNIHVIIDMAPHKEAIFQALEEHRGLRTVAFNTFPPYYNILADVENDPEHIRQQDHWYSSLERLLSRNRRINVCDDRGKRYTNGSSIDKLYALNDFYNGSSELLKEDSTLLRPLHVATALTAGASANFQCAALLLSDHTDILCEFLHNEETIDSSERES